MNYAIHMAAISQIRYAHYDLHAIIIKAVTATT